MGQQRTQQLVAILQSSATWTTAFALASELGCSPRTVKSDVAALNRQTPGLVEASGKGYRLADAGRAAELLVPAVADVPQTAEERKRQILFDLLMRHRDVSAEELAGRLCISLATLDNELVPIKRELAGYGLTLCQRAGRLFVYGSPAREKKLVSQLIFDETKGFFTQVDLINQYFPRLDLPALQRRVDGCLRDAGYYINGYALSNLILHIAIFVERTLNGFATGAGASTLAKLAGAHHDDPALDALVARVRAVIEDVCGVGISAGDMESLRLMLSANLINSGGEAPDDPEFRAALELFGRIELRVRDEYGLDFSDRDFQLRFSLHLANLLSRSRQGMWLRNPQLRDIKEGCPFIYEVAVFVAGEVQEATGIQVAEDEIAYIALHVGCLAEEQQANADKLHAVFVSLRHNATDAGRLDDFSRELRSRVVIDGAVSSVADIADPSGIDLLVSSVPVAPGHPVPVVSVSPFLSHRDLEAVSERVRSLMRVRRRSALEWGMRTFFSKEFFAIQLAAVDWRDLLLSMSEALVAGGYAFADFGERLLERERMASSVYGDIAMPHPVDMDARRTAVSVALFPKGISWDGSVVYLVVMLAIRRADRAFFRDIFDHIAGVLSSPGAVRAIARAHDYEGFIEALLSYV